MRTIALMLFLIGLAAQEPLAPRGQAQAVITGPLIQAMVPAEQAQALRPLVARAEALYARIAADAGYQPRRLRLIISNDADTHNGFSTTVPIPIVQVELAPALADSTIHDGHGHVERTLIHEFTHHVANDRPANGFNRVMGWIFGRVLPNDIFSLITFYCTAPAHVFQPSFWQEGMAQWAETTYSEASSPWAGRGRDSLTHMVWRLDAAAGGIPPVGDWRLTLHRWPYGHESYLYGLAYLRHIAGRTTLDPWRLLDDQTRCWPFFFSRGAQRLAGQEHDGLISEARTCLMAEQLARIADLKTFPLITYPRLSPVQSNLGAPAWLDNQRLAAALHQPQHRARLAIFDGQGGWELTRQDGHLTPALRSDGQGGVVFTAYDHRLRSRLARWHPDGTSGYGPRGVIEADAWAADRQVVVRLTGDGRQQLQVVSTAIAGFPWSWLPACLRGKGLTATTTTVLPSQDRPWSPVVRPGSVSGSRGQLAWVETDAQGSRLLLGDLELGANPPTLGRTVLVQVRGRIIHPTWAPDGRRLYYCADHTGVANAWCLMFDASDKVASPMPVTNTLGGVVACVPSPDGSRLALIDHDHQGPYLALLSADPVSWAKGVASIVLAWPAPVDPTRPVAGNQAAAGAGANRAPLAPSDQDPAVSQPAPYWAISHLRPLWWTPTTQPAPEGGFGAVGLMADPLFRLQMLAGAGVGANEYHPVGMAGLDYSGLRLDVGGFAWQSERTYADEIEAVDGREADYTELNRGLELRVGRGISGLEADWSMVLAAGWADWQESSRGAEKYDGWKTVNQPAFTGDERYLELDLAWNNRLWFPTSFAPEDGVSASARFRHSGFDGDLERNSVYLDAGTAIPTWRSGGQQLALYGAAGWSDGPRILQGAFSVGGALGLGLPRGYGDRQASGRCLAAGSVAYRAALWRPMRGCGTTPFVHRQLVAEVFFDTATVADRSDGLGDEWWSSAGVMVHSEWYVADMVRLQPGLGLACQLDGDQDTVVLFSLSMPY